MAEVKEERQTCHQLSNGRGETVHAVSWCIGDLVPRICRRELEYVGHTMDQHVGLYSTALRDSFILLLLESFSRIYSLFFEGRTKT